MNKILIIVKGDESDFYNACAHRGFPADRVEHRTTHNNQSIGYIRCSTMEFFSPRLEGILVDYGRIIIGWYEEEVIKNGECVIGSLLYWRAIK